MVLVFFQAEDGIRDYKVTGVQTCALPIFDAKGTVRGDTEFDRASLDRLENHLLRPEVQQALSTGVGRAERLSASTNERRMYVAVRGGPGGPPVVPVSTTLAAPGPPVDAVHAPGALPGLGPVL